MDRTRIKNYAPKARRDFREAVKGRLALFGIRQENDSVVIEPLVRDGVSVLIGGRAYPRSVGEKRHLLEMAVNKDGFEQTIERLAYTWFNRLVAIRYMELHGYLDHGYRVLSHSEDKAIPEILERAELVELPGLDKERVIELKLDGNKDEELYRLLLTAQCNALHSAMPFLFERVDDETELALPENLLHSDSVIRRLVTEVEEDSWREIEVVGWIYQSYLSERKAEVIGQVVKSGDIPAATQLFTPNWIVRYLTQNTLGRKWLATYPQSPLRQQLEFYVEPPEQTPEVREQLRTITPTTLLPEKTTFLDPACGSGHILVEAYDLFKSIYQERGYRAKDIPSLILSKNLFGLEIDDRAAQLAKFALLMKARKDDHRLFDGDSIQLNIFAIQETKGFNAHEVTGYLNQPIFLDHPPASRKSVEDPESLITRDRMSALGDIAEEDIADLISLFDEGKTFGSLIEIPENLTRKLYAIEERARAVAERGHGLSQLYAAKFLAIVEQASCLARKFDCVVTNPPYMGAKSFNPQIKHFASKNFPTDKADLFSLFAVRLLGLTEACGFLGLMTPFTWMFIKSFEPLRRSLSQENTLHSLIQPEYHAFFDSAFVPICSFVVQKHRMPKYSGVFIGLSDFYGEDIQSVKALEAVSSADCAWRYLATSEDFEKIPGSPIAFLVGNAVRNVFARCDPLSIAASPSKGLFTGDNGRFIRFWWEVAHEGILRDCTSHDQSKTARHKWYPLQKGGENRKWYGNEYCVINFQYDGEELRSFKGYGERNPEFYFQEALSWTKITSSSFSARYASPGHLFDDAACVCPVKSGASIHAILAFLNSKVGAYLLSAISQTLNYSPGEIGRLPYISMSGDTASRTIRLVQLAKDDWDSAEVSLDFAVAAMATTRRQCQHLEASWGRVKAVCEGRLEETQQLEELNNSLFIEAYGLQGELTPKVPDGQNTLYRPERSEDIKRLVSYAIGCMVGRYSLDKPGLIYANAGGVGFDPAQYTTFRADDDGILALTEADWGLPDDAASRFVEFLSVAWPKQYLDENLTFVAESLDSKKGEPPRESIRRYLATGFYKHHLQMYKRRPIYWLFSSGKLRAFQCLVYLHRYNEGTLARMRTEYVIPLQGRIAGRIQQLEADEAKPASTAHLKKIRKELDSLKKQEAELRAFDEKLKHYADKRIALDLDDGVKVNYGKFGDLLAEVKAVTGGKDDE